MMGGVYDIRVEIVRGKGGGRKEERVKVYIQE